MEKKKKVPLTEESPESSAAENVFWVNTGLMLFPLASGKGHFWKETAG